MKFHKEPFSSGGLVPKSCVPVDEENLYVAGYKTIKDLRKTEPKLFLKVGDKEFLRISIPMEKNGVRFCIAARVDWWMYQHPYTQEDYWLPLAFLYFDREHYKITKEMKFFDLTGNISLIPYDKDNVYCHFIDSFNKNQMGSKSVLEEVVRFQEFWRGKEVIKEVFGVDSIKNLLK